MIASITHQLLSGVKTPLSLRANPNNLARLLAACSLGVAFGCGDTPLRQDLGQPVPAQLNAGHAPIEDHDAAGSSSPAPPEREHDAGMPLPAAMQDAPSIECGGAPAPSMPDGGLPDCTDLPDGVAQRWLVFDSDRESYNRDLYLVKADGSGLVRLTSEPSSELDAAFAPDGQRLAFASDASGSMQIYVLELESGKRTQLTQLAAGADQPSWSADGKQIVFHSSASVFIMQADGSGQREVARGLDDFNAFKNPSLAADGSEVVFDRNNEIDAAHLDGSQQRYVVRNWTTTEETPAVSPDGHNVAYAVRCASEEQIAVVPFAGMAADPCQVTFATAPDIGAARNPAWGPDNLLAFERGITENNVPQRTTIAITMGPGKPVCDVIGGPYQSHGPSWAPAGFSPPATKTATP